MTVLRFLIPEPYHNYDLARPPGTTNLGSGIGIKYARVAEACDMAKRIYKVEDAADADIVFADWLWFCVGRVDREEQVKAFLKLSMPKVIYGSEMCALGWPRNLLRALTNRVELVTHCCDYQRRLYRPMGIYHSAYLSDPVPEHVFCPSPAKRCRLVCMGQISAAKRSEKVVELFQRLKGSHVETVYLGNVRMWGAQHHDKLNNALQEQIAYAADTYISSASQAQTAEIVNESSFFAHVAHHDTASESQQENTSAANVTFALTHPLMRERTNYRYETIEAMADEILTYPFAMDEHEDDMVEALTVADRWSYASFSKQMEGVIKTLL